MKDQRVHLNSKLCDTDVRKLRYSKLSECVVPDETCFYLRQKQHINQLTVHNLHLNVI